MNQYLQNLVYLVIVLLIFILIFIAARLVYSPALFSLDDLGPLAVIAGVLVAIFTFIFNQMRSASEEYLENSIALLSKAYDVLVSTKDDQGRPLNRRINWLTSARLIKAAQNISSLITEKSHVHIWEENQEYWRGRFSDAINPDRNSFPQEYYAEYAQDFMVWGSSERQDPLSEKSLAMLYRFVRWNDKREDPLADVPNFSDYEIEYMSAFGPRNLGNLFRELRQLQSGKKKVDDSLIR